MGLEDSLTQTVVEQLKLYANMRKDYVAANDQRKYQIDDIVFGIVNKLNGKEAQRRMYYLKKYYEMSRE